MPDRSATTWTTTPITNDDIAGALLDAEGEALERLSLTAGRELKATDLTHDEPVVNGTDLGVLWRHTWNDGAT